MVIRIHPQCALSRLPSLQDHLVLETLPPFRIILHWTTLDPEFLEYACYNLLTNAVKYSPANTSITVRAWRHRENVRISVEDRGYGMDENEIKQIFRKFYRTSRAQQSSQDGTGLGLAIVEEIVVQHGGSIEVESRINRGSRFTLSLPRADGHAARTA